MPELIANTILLIDYQPLILSFKLALLTTFILLPLAIPLAYWFSGKQYFWKLLIEACFTMPLVLPPSVLGFYLLVAFNPSHNPAKWLLEHLNIDLAFSFKGLLVGSIIYSLPFMLGPIKAAFQQLPTSLKQASFAIGKTKIQTFYYILLPNMKAAIASGMVLTLAHTLGEFGVVLMIGGNIPGKTRLASMAIYDSVETMNYAEAYTYSYILFAITFILVLGTFMFNRTNLISTVK